MPKPIATWNPARDAWETDQGSFCGHWAAFSGTWPTSGTTRSGTAYALPTSALLTADSGSSSLLPTPEAKLSDSGPDYARAGRDGSGGDDLTTTVFRALLPAATLPTPRVAASRTGYSAATRQDSMSGPSLEQAVEIARGELPREFQTWEELPPSWQPEDYAATDALMVLSGGRTPTRSDDGSNDSDGMLPLPPN